MNDYCVYIHRRASDNKIFYVGKGSTSRPKSPSGRSAYWHRIVEKHGITISIVKASMNEECALSYERALIAALGRDSLCNHTDGGDGCRNPSAETRRKMSLAKKGKAKSPEAIAKFVAKMLGRKMPRDAIERTRLAHIGSKRSEESKAKMRASARLRWESSYPSFPVRCSVTGLVHRTCHEASRWLRENGHPKAEARAVKEAALGERLTAYGRAWVHV